MKVSRPGLSLRPKTWAMVTLVFLLVLACYWPAVQGELLWDDTGHVTRADLRSWEGLIRIWFEIGAAQQYYPVLHTAFWIEHRIWGDSTTAYHLLNMLLHATACCLLALVLRRLWTPSIVGIEGHAAYERPVPGGTEWLAALIFAVHPVCVESVAWIAEQKNTLSLVFYLLAAYLYFGFVKHRGWRSYIGATVVFMLALGTKTMTASLPAALLVALWWKNGKLRWRVDVAALLPWFFLALAAGLLTAWVERTIIGAEGADYDLTFLERVLLAGRIVWFYLGKLFWPVDLAFFYERWDVPALAMKWVGYLAAAVAVTLAFVAIRRRTRGPLASWLLFVGALFPALGFFNVFPFIFSYVADHFQYLASTAIIAGVSTGAAQLFTRGPHWLLQTGRLACAATIVVLALLTHRQSGWYRDNETLFRATLANNPESWMAHHILGVELAKSSEPARRSEALVHFREALRIHPQSPDVHLGIGIELARTPEGKAEAIAHYERALELRPHFAEAHNNLAVELARMPDRLADVIAHCEAALRVRPSFPEAHVNLADALARVAGRSSEAPAHYAEALRLRPNYPEAHNGLAYELAKVPSRRDEAIWHFEEALRQKPDFAEAHFNLANTFADLPGRSQEAIAHYERALRLAPDSAPIHFNLAGLLAALPGRHLEAIAHYESAIRLKPDAAEAHASLATVLANQPGRLDEAIAHEETALRIDPSLAWVHHNLSFHLSQIPGREAAAIAHAQTALQLKPDNVAAHNQLAALYAQSDRLEEARHHWQQALRIDPNYEAARKNLQLLEESSLPPTP